ncbi:6-hydroxymethylpterin diphosphokinase MptE-like protein [Leptospira neocaledonica]|uniref:6-hydroxymethylpterin diphosphokinase MptE-like domain-containing protein n=1 Tax=Leptospira neocaledonica TaxID=2023192 RepID=A0A2M9ZW21_9LEPT|nr:6-hydroxymethylpterin diphosphokinase MptE-like protein [Leptospira neocaledonica]PJZ76173.1 hypothetical protein CH365_15220 [Leptospira neocaledonica]
MKEENSSFHLHSTQNPIKEGERISLSIPSPLQKDEFLVIIGVGCGYHTISYLKSVEDTTKILLLEPFSELEALVGAELKEKLGGVPIYYGWEKFEKLNRSDWMPSSTKNLRIFIHPNYSRRYPELSDRILSFFSKKESVSQNKLAKQEFGRLWVRNFFKHMKKSSENPNLYRILGRSITPKSGRIGCFVGASPNLESEIDWIRKNREKFFLLSSDTALGYLLENDIQPHGVLSIDSGLGTFYHFPENVPENIPIFTWFGGACRIFDLKNPKIIYLSTHPLDQILGAKFYPRAPILENPSLNVAGLAISLLRTLGAESVLLKGFGFERDAGKTHCRSTGYERYDRFFIDRRRSLYNSRYTPESRWKTRTSVLEILQKWSPIPILSEIDSKQETFSGWENSLENYPSSFPGSGQEWRKLCSGISELPSEIHVLLPRETKLLDPIT